MEYKQKMSHRRSKIIDRSWKAEDSGYRMAEAEQPPPSPKSPYQPQAGLIGIGISGYRGIGVSECISNVFHTYMCLMYP